MTHTFRIKGVEVSQYSVCFVRLGVVLQVSSVCVCVQMLCI